MSGHDKDIVSFSRVKAYKKANVNWQNSFFGFKIVPEKFQYILVTLQEVLHEGDVLALCQTLGHRTSYTRQEYYYYSSSERENGTVT